MNFVHLHCHSSHSLLDGLGNPNEWVIAAKSKNMKALALTDHGSCSAAFEFYKAAKREGIVPIVGTEFYITDDPASRPAKGEKKRPPRYHLTVLAKNWTGLKSIFAQLSLANHQFYYKPLLSFEQCQNFTDCVVMSACAVGVCSHPNYENLIRQFHKTYGDDFYIEIMPHPLLIQKTVNERAVLLCRKYGISPVATNDCHYPKVEDTLTHDMLLAIQTNRKPGDEKYFSFLEGDEPLDGLYLKSTIEMIHSFSPWVKENVFDSAFVVKAIKNTNEIAEKCSSLEIPNLHFSLPMIPGLRDSSTEEVKYLLQQIQTGWKRLIPDSVDQKIYQERLFHELRVISKIGAIRYFLIVWDIIREAKEQGILCGFGRGSAGGSLVAYLLGIVGLDPIQYELYFERFLREDRIDMPDIDLDFAGKDRDKIIQYIRDSYGDENVSHISTSSYMHGKTAFRDVARVFGIPYPVINELSKRIDNDLPLHENFESDPILGEFAIKNPQIVRHAARLDGQLRSKGLHAGGVIISEDGFTHRGVLEYRQKATTINWHMDEVENFGLLKVDILGLNNLSVLNDTALLVQKRTGKKVNYFDIKPDNPEVLKQFSDGFTAGFFQFESNGISSLCKRLAPIEKFETLIHINALYRPGPLDSGMVESYVRRYRKEEGITYNHPKETEVAEQTLGLPIFQEQIMAYFVRLAGFSWPEADNMRKIIAKSKGIEKLEENRPVFVNGCHKTSGIAEETANVLYDQIVKFGKYGFNKSHAADYSLIAYLTAWAKYHYPVEFMCSLLRSVTDETDQTAKYIEEARRLKIDILPPDINKSENTFSVAGEAILTGFASIKGVGPTSAMKVQDARNEAGRFESFQHFLDLTDRRSVNKKTVEALARAGAFRSICHNTKWIIDCYPALIKSARAAAEAPHPGEYSDFDSRTKDSMKIEAVPGVFSGDDIEVFARMEIDKPVLEMLQEQIRECNKCELFNPKGSGPIPFDFGRDNRILVVSQKISAQEQAVDKPLAGKMGAKVNEIFRERLDLTPGKFLKTTMFHCRPPGDKLEKEAMEKCKCAKLWLDKLIMATKPEVIFAMGAAAHRFFTGKSHGINDANGTTLWLPAYQSLVVFAIHPGQLFFDSTGEKEDKFIAAVDKLKDYL